MATGFPIGAEHSPLPLGERDLCDGATNRERHEGLATLTLSVGLPVHCLKHPAGLDAPRAVMHLLRAAAQDTVLVTFANPAAAQHVRSSPAFADRLRAFDLVLPDGIGLCLAIRWLHGLRAPRVSFDMTSLAPAIFEHARRESLGVVLVGGRPGITARARDRLAERFPGLDVIGVFDGYSDIAGTIRLVASLQPRIVVCGMGVVRQETFMLDLKAQGWRGWGFTCGGFFDQLQAGVKYYPAWIDRMNLRWAYRLFREPGRLWRRYLLDYGTFGLLVAGAVRRKARHARTGA